MRSSIPRSSCAAGSAPANGSTTHGPFARDFELAGRRHTIVPVLAESGRVNVDLFFDEHGPHLLAPGQTAETWPDVAWNPTLRLAELGDGSGAVARGTDKVFVIRKGRQTTVALVDPLDVDVDHLEGDGGGLVNHPCMESSSRSS